MIYLNIAKNAQLPTLNKKLVPFYLPSLGLCRVGDFQLTLEQFEAFKNRKFCLPTFPSALPLYSLAIITEVNMYVYSNVYYYIIIGQVVTIGYML